jgi:molybdopterin converting factor small subunit
VARIFLTGELRTAAGGAAEIDVRAESMRELHSELERRFPELAEKLGGDLAVAIDGEIFPNAQFELLEADSEVHFLPPVKGG